MMYVRLALKELILLCMDTGIRYFGVYTFHSFRISDYPNYFLKDIKKTANCFYLEVKSHLFCKKKREFYSL